MQGQALRRWLREVGVAMILLVLFVMMRRSLMAATGIAAVWMPQHMRQFFLTFVIRLVGELFHQNGIRESNRPEPEVVTDQSQTLYSSREDK
jgi:hypothetical protein